MPTRQQQRATVYASTQGKRSLSIAATGIPRVATLLAGALALWLCPLSPAPGSGPPAAAAPPQPNVVVVVVDTLRADRMRALGRRLPYLSRIATRGAQFEQAVSSSSWTPTATASIFTGLRPDQHGVRAGHLALDGRRLAPVDRLPQNADSLPLVMRGAGYRTIGVSDNVNVGETMGFARGFDVFVQHHDAGAAAVTRSARGALTASDAPPPGGPSAPAPVRPYFLYLHLMDPHAPYQKRPGYRAPANPAGEAMARYDSEIVNVDRQLGALHRLAGWDDNTLIVFTSDHGEAFGEHGIHGHPNQLHEELLAVPLVFFAPGRIAPRRFFARVGTIDVLPTLRRLLGLPAAHQDAGADLSGSLLRGAEPDARAHFAMRYSDLLSPPLVRRAVYADGFKMVTSSPSGRRQLFELEHDPTEGRDLATREAPRVARMLGLLDELATRGPHHPTTRLQPAGAGAEDSDQLLQQLRALGYTR